MGDGSVAGERGGSEQLFHITDNQTPRLGGGVGGGQSREKRWKREDEVSGEERKGGQERRSEGKYRNEVKYD